MKAFDTSKTVILSEAKDLKAPVCKILRFAQNDILRFFKGGPL